MKRSLIVSLTLLIAYSVYSQQPDIIKESWEPNPTLHKLDKKYDNESAVVLLDKRRVEYIDGKEELVIYRTLHKIIKVNDDKGIEAFNTVYLGVSDNSDIVDIRARTILPNQKIVEIDRKNVKDLKDEDGNQYKIFALEGLEKGCEVEYFYTYKSSTSFFGREILQAGFPVLEARLDIVSPQRLIFESRLYNTGNIQTRSDTASLPQGKRILSIAATSIDGVEEEKYSNYRANLLRAEFKLSYNTARSSREKLFTWNELAKRVYENYSSWTEKEIKRVKNFIESNKWDKLATEQEKIIAVENYLKQNIATREDIYGDEARNLEQILRNKIASYFGIVRLYGAIYSQLGVDYQFVLTGNREDYAIDKSFENWNNSENPVLYFPAQKKYLAPTRIEMRYPYITPHWGATNGLFCKGTTIGNYTTAIAEIKPVALESYADSYSNIDAVVKLNPTLDTLYFDMKQLYNGYSASFYRAAFNFSSAEDQKNMIKELVRFGTNSENIIESGVQNKEFENYSANKPFVLKATVKSTELLERAGNKILVKLGEVIGQQVEMYQEKPRRLPMEIDYPHVLERTIQLHIPEGYAIKNPDDVKINVVYKENGTPTMGFVSDYKLEGNVLKVHILEEYRNTFYPLSQYEDFKRVINAAADFNKVALVLEKK